MNGSSAAPTLGIWIKWSITENHEKPFVSAHCALRFTASKISCSPEPKSQDGLWMPNFIAFLQPFAKLGLDKPKKQDKLSLISYHHTTIPRTNPVYTPIQSGRLYEKIVEQIEQRILSGDLKTGDRLPAERELCEQFGVSRTAVREAVKALSEKGLADVQPGRGTFITNGSSRAMRYSLGMLGKFGRAKGSSDLVEVREMFEPEIAALAASRADDEGS